MGFSQQEYWRGLPFPPPGHLLNSGIEPMSLTPPALAGRFFTTEPPAKTKGGVGWKLFKRQLSQSPPSTFYYGVTALLSLHKNLQVYSLNRLKQGLWTGGHQARLKSTGVVSRTDGVCAECCTPRSAALLSPTRSLRARPVLPLEADC